MSPLDLVHVGFEFDGSCADLHFRRFCSSLGTQLWDYTEPNWNFFPNELRQFYDNHTLALNLLVFVNGGHAEAFVNGSPSNLVPKTDRPDLASTIKVDTRKLHTTPGPYLTAVKLDNETFRVSINHCPAAWALVAAKYEACSIFRVLPS
jgi:hypothetical protein